MPGTRYPLADIRFRLPETRYPRPETRDPNKKKNPDNHRRVFSCASSCFRFARLLRRETPESTADIAFAETFQSAVAQLADSLAGDAEH